MPAIPTTLHRKQGMGGLWFEASPDKKVETLSEK
jgi:hypothetical protein